MLHSVMAGIFFGILIATMMLPDVVTLVPRFIMFKSFDWIDTFYPLIVPYWTGISALYVFLAVQFLKGLPVELEEAAYIDGANRLQIIIRIILPLSKPALGVVAIQTFIAHWSAFLRPLIFLNSTKNFTVAIALRQFQVAYGGTPWHLLMAGSLVALVPTITMFFVGQRFFVQGVVVTGVKG